MLLLLAGLSSFAGVTITEEQVLTDVQVACNYTGDRVRVLAPEGHEYLVELLADTCAQVRSCSSRARPREILDWHGRKGTCAVYYRPDQAGWYSEGLGFCGPVAAGRAITPLDWPPAQVDLQAWCHVDHTHPACLLQGPVAWHGPCPPQWSRQGQICTPPQQPVARGEQSRWTWGWSQDALHPPSASLPPKAWTAQPAGLDAREGIHWLPLTGCAHLPSWVALRQCRLSRATGRAPLAAEQGLR